MAGHHADSCRLLMKLHQALSYLRMDPIAPFKKQTHVKGRSSYQQNNAMVRSLQDTGFIPFDDADADNFLDIVNDDLQVFTPDVINNAVTANTGQE